MDVAKKSLIYVTHARLPTEKAHGVQMANSAHAFGNYYETTLLKASQPNPLSESVFEYYKLSLEKIRVVSLPSLGFLRRSRFGYWLRSLSFSFVACFYIFFHLPSVLYSREPFPLLFFTMFPKRRLTTVYEMHDFPIHHLWFHKFLSRRVSHIVTTNTWAKEQCVERFHIPKGEITVAPNGYNEALFSGKLNTRNLFSDVPPQNKILMYSGNLFDWKGVDVFLAAALCIEGVTPVVIGGSGEDQEVLKSRFRSSSIRWFTHMKQEELACYISEADVLVLPNVPINQHSKYSTSPIKLFEYMAMGIPVVASDLPSIRSIVSDEYVSYAEAGSVESLTSVLEDTLHEYTAAEKKAEAAKEYVGQFRWSERARKIHDQLGV